MPLQRQAGQDRMAEIMRRLSHPGHTQRRMLVRRGVEVLCLVYLVAVLGLVVLMNLPGSIFPSAALLFLYAPRWVVTAPLIVLAPFAVWKSRRGLAWLAVASWLVVFPVLGFVVPWMIWLPGPSGKPSVRILTCNITGGSSDHARLSRLIEESQPDIVLIQELWGSDPRRFLPGSGWTFFTDEKELLIASRRKLENFRVANLRRVGGKGGMCQVDLVLPEGRIRVVNLHAVSLRGGLTPIVAGDQTGLDKFEDIVAIHARESAEMRRQVDQEPGPLIVAGDFNMTIENPAYRSNWSELSNAFSVAGFGIGSTFNTRLIGLRIDHILAGPGWKVRRCWVGPDVRSQHMPLLADLEWVGDPQVQLRSSSGLGAK